MKIKPKRYFLIWSDSKINYRALTNIAKLSEEKRLMLKNSSALLFKVVNDEIVQIAMNGRLIGDTVNVDDQELRIAYKNGYNQALEDNKIGPKYKGS